MTQRMRSAGVVEVLEVVVCEGEGNGQPPGEIFREVTYYFGKGGALLAKNDPVAEHIERGEPDARTRQVLAVSAENDRLRRQVADLHAAIALVKGVRVAIRPETSGAEAALRQLWRLLPPAQRDTGDEADCVRDEP